MTREDAIAILRCLKDREAKCLELIRRHPHPNRLLLTIQAIDMAIDALERERTDEWCTDCKEYDTEKKCCPRFNRVIRGALEREPSEDGTLEVKVEDATKVGRVLISDDKHRGGLYYPDEYEPQSVSFENDAEIKSCSKDSDLISRAEAIKAVNRAKDEGMINCPTYYLGIVPSADRPKGKWIYWREDGIKRCKCSRCLTSYGCLDTPYCPNCGEKMVEGRSEE